MILEKSMVDFVVSTDKEISILESLTSIRNYASSLKQPLELSMLVPCKLVDGVWVVLEDKGTPDWNDYNDEEGGNIELYRHNLKEYKEYQQAKERVLFEGFEYKKELRNSGGNYTHLLKKEDIEIYIQWGGFHLFGKYQLKTLEDLLPYKLTLTPAGEKELTP